MGSTMNLLAYTRLIQDSRATEPTLPSLSIENTMSTDDDIATALEELITSESNLAYSQRIVNAVTAGDDNREVVALLKSTGSVVSQH